MADDESQVPFARAGAHGSIDLDDRLTAITLDGQEFAARGRPQQHACHQRQIVGAVRTPAEAGVQI